MRRSANSAVHLMKLSSIVRGLILLSLVIIGGCGSKGAEDPYAEPFTLLAVPFDPNAVLYVKNAGTAKVTGKVELATDSGPVLGDFANMRLVPVAEYSRAVMNFLFQGKKVYWHGRQVDNLDRRYNQFMRHGRTDHRGNYTFHGVPGGDYYVYATMANHNTGVYYAVMDMVKVEEGRTYRMDLDGI